MDASPALPTADSDTTTPPRRRVLISCFAIAPNAGSEPGVAWNLCSRLAKYHDVTVLACTELGEEHFRDEVERYCQEQGAIGGLRFEFVDRPLLSRLLQQTHLTLTAPLYYLGYAAWQRAAFRAARRLHQEHPFDLTHQLTITSFREPGYLWKLSTPFVWGPVVGAADVPWSYFSILTRRDQLFYGLRNLVNAWHKRTKLRSRRAALAARWIWVSGQDNRALVTDRWGAASHVMVETGTTSAVGAVRRYDGQRPLRLIWSGLHVGRKALPLLLRALTQCKSANYELTVLGDGRQRSTWQAQAKLLGIDARITWTGHLPREQALQKMSDADVFVFTSVQEGASSVVMEALSRGLPVVCHDACGMALAVDDACGIKVPLINPDQSVEGFARALDRLMAEKGLVEQLSRGALERTGALSWDEKGKQIARVYDHVVKSSPPPIGKRRASGSSSSGPPLTSVAVSPVSTARS